MDKILSVHWQIGNNVTQSQHLINFWCLEVGSIFNFRINLIDWELIPNEVCNVRVRVFVRGSVRYFDDF